MSGERKGLHNVHNIVLQNCWTQRLTSLDSMTSSQLLAIIFVITLRKLYFHFLSHWMGYDRGDGFPFNFEPNGIPFGSKSKGILSPRSYTIRFERKWESSFLSAMTEMQSLWIWIFIRVSLIKKLICIRFSALHWLEYLSSKNETSKMCHCNPIKLTYF